MASSKRRLATDALQTRIATVTVANGYQRDINSVQKYRKRKVTGDTEFQVNDFNTLPLVILTTEGNAMVEVEGEESIADETERFLDVLAILYFVHDQEDDSDTETDDLADDFVSDIEKAVMADATLAGAVVWSQIRDWMVMEAEDDEGEPWCIVPISIRMQYNYVYDDPYT